MIRSSLTSAVLVGAMTLSAACGGDRVSTDGRPRTLEEALGFDEASMQEREAKVQEQVRRCMKAQGFDYVPMDPSQQKLVRIGPGGGNDDRGFRRTKGYGVSTVLGVAAGEQGLASDPNERIRQSLSEEDRKAYDRALFGQAATGGGPVGGIIIREEPGPAGGGADAGGQLEGGCFQSANRKVGGGNLERLGPKLEELEERINGDPRLVKADAAWSRCMAEAGHRYERPQDIVADLMARMAKLSGAASSGSGPVRPPDPDDPGLVDLQREELALAGADDECSDRTRRGEVARRVRAEAERRFLEDNPDFGQDTGRTSGSDGGTRKG